MLKIITLLALCAQAALGQDITFTNRTATFTNLEGRVYTNVTLIRANDYGIVWRGDGMGMVRYTNLAPAVLTSLGIGQERMDRARALLARRAIIDARDRQQAAEATAEQQARNAEWTAGAPERARQAKARAKQEQIQALAGQIAAAEHQLKVDQAVANDLTMSTPDWFYVKREAHRQLEIDDAKARLRALQSQ
jgi:hypothetical protein